PDRGGPRHIARSGRGTPRARRRRRNPPRSPPAGAPPRSVAKAVLRLPRRELAKVFPLGRRYSAKGAERRLNGAFRLDSAPDSYAPRHDPPSIADEDLRDRRGGSSRGPRRESE